LGLTVRHSAVGVGVTEMGEHEAEIVGEAVGDEIPRAREVLEPYLSIYGNNR